MTTRDSGVIDLFAIHKEEEVRMSAAPSAPPPAMAMDILPAANLSGGGALDTSEIEDFAEITRRTRRKRMKMVGGLLGGLAVVGILVFAITTGTGKPAPAPAAAAAAPPPPTATFVPPPPPTPEPAPVAKTDDAKDKNDKGGYTREGAIAANNAAHGKKTPKAAPARAAAPAKAAGPKIQKVQSSGVTE